MTIKIGPSGVGPVKEIEENFREFHRLGFKCAEIAFTYSVYIKEKDCAEIKKLAEELGISLSIHAHYFVNLNSAEEEKIESSKQRILQCCEIGELLGATHVVFHPGFYGKTPREEAGEKIKECVKEMMAHIKKKDWKIKLAPETMGKINVFGSIEEISNLVEETGCSFCIDFAHILAREKKVDFKKIEKAFPQKKWHCHFSGIIYGEKGERSHKKTQENEWEELFSNLPKDKDITIICESPTRIEDSVEALDILSK